MTESISFRFQIVTAKGSFLRLVVVTKIMCVTTKRIKTSTVEIRMSRDTSILDIYQVHAKDGLFDLICLLLSNGWTLLQQRVSTNSPSSTNNGRQADSIDLLNFTLTPRMRAPSWTLRGEANRPPIWAKCCP